MSDPINWTQQRKRLGDLTPWPRNPRQIKTPQAKRLLASVQEFGQVETLAIGPDGDIYNGHQRLAVLMERYGADYEVDVRVSSRPLTEKEREKLTVYLHKGAAGEWNFDTLANEFDVDELIEWGFEAFELGLGGDDEPGANTDEAPPSVSLADRFIVPPFSVLDARQGYWQDRKRAWIALGIESELGRGSTPGTSARSDEPTYREIGNRKSGTLGAIAPNEGGENGILARTGKYAPNRANATPGGSPLPAATLNDDGKTVRGDGRGRPMALAPSATLLRLKPSADPSGTSIFDPVLCELAYAWFTAPDGHVLDPFAGGSVRGIVATYLGRDYTGVDLRPEQIEANQQQAAGITPDRLPRWIVGNSLWDIPAEDYDFIFTCPPYYDLEVYSDHPEDLSNKGDYDSFLIDYRSIIKKAVDRLRDDRFACVVVGDIRDKKGMYRNFVSDTIAAFRDAGMALYNEAILVTAVGSLSIRVGRQFESGRKLGKTHQNVLVFVKGDPKKATAWCGPVEIGALVESEDDQRLDMQVDSR